MWKRLFAFIMPGTPPPRTASHTERAIDVLLEGLPDAAVRYRTDFTIEFINRAAENLLGINREAVVGNRVEPGWVERPHYRLFAQILFPSLAPASVERSEPNVWPQVVSLTFEEPHREFTATTIRLPHSNENSFQFVKIIRDETRTSEVFARQSEFVTVAAHQLRTPLTALRWSLENVSALAAKHEEIGSLLNESLGLVDRSLKIVNDFLDAAKIEEGKFGFTFEPTDLVALLDALVGAIAPIAERYEVAVRFSHEGIPALMVSADATRLSTALANLLDNAVRYNVRGGTVTVTLAKGTARAEISIADTGIGIPKGEEQKIFQKLERGSNAIQAEPNGSGLGLYLAKNIIEAHRGSITFTSEPERGTTFTITLPLSAARQ